MNSEVVEVTKSTPACGSTPSASKLETFNAVADTILAVQMEISISEANFEVFNPRFLNLFGSTKIPQGLSDKVFMKDTLNTASNIYMK